ncbi:MAG: bifunctional phosphopantothenoylcysteine decarboxylase/phosphopantothenate--cysteine ligase CoaBC [Gammaproteobacteria bacterium]|nr:bifunctional phosphopantothenoylcysteine decarboxylase/phosphopantothenate--cysteine ligase CoaBC [Gammaproteobacteria bacterium]MDH5630916.1 bifunctional phosphopantothenoylcysteine decarboxylase/phosphopantothenate--cysteine ligase CoaBC [Gammaproteobacteria bacterium]
MQKLPHKNLVLGICGGIAAYKCADLVRRLKEQNFDVRVVMTQAAKEFITPMTLQAVSGHPVHSELFDAEMEAAMGHIELGKWADYILIAPATANTIAKLVHGEANDLLTTLVLASQAQVIVAPAMNQQMWSNATTQQNIKNLIQQGIILIEPASGVQACGDVGVGRMPEPADIANMLADIAFQPQTLKSKHIVITAGPTVEPIDPVRFLSNHSSGKMGYALARAALQAGAKVTLISGPVNIQPPKVDTFISVTTASQMFDAVKQNFDQTDIFIGCAAVADYAPDKVSEQKIKKKGEQINLLLKPNPDIISWVGNQKDKPFVVGFAAESEHLQQNAIKKLKTKGLNLICANDISQPGVGFNSSSNRILMIDDNLDETLLETDSKDNLAKKIIFEIGSKIIN